MSIRWLVREYCAKIVVNPRRSNEDLGPLWQALADVHLAEGVGLDVSVDTEAEG